MSREIKRHRASPYDTLICFLQNAAGAKKWPVEKRRLALLKNAMATGVPTTQEAGRRLKRGRGCAPEDGGGGVYKGKKKNKQEDKTPNAAPSFLQNQQKQKQRPAKKKAASAPALYKGQSVTNFC